MKIFFDPEIFSMQKYGGISRYFCQVANEMEGLPNLDLRIYCFFYINKYLSSIPQKIVIGGEGIFWPLRLIPFPKLRHWINVLLNVILFECLCLIERPDIVHRTYYWPILIRKKETKYIITVYDMIAEKIPSSQNGFSIASKLKRIAIKQADHIICISDNTRKDLLEITKISPQKISVVYLGFMSKIFAGQDDQLMTSRRPFILFVGNRGGYKNFSLVLRAYCSRKSIGDHYDLVCFGGGAFSDDEIKLHQNSGGGGGRVYQQDGDDKKLSNFYRNAAVFVYPSMYEGFGMPPLEAMAHGCPVICSNSSSIPEVVGDAGIYFDPDDHLAAAAAMEQVLYCQDTREALIERGYVRSRQFSWRSCAENTVSIYEHILL